MFAHGFVCLEEGAVLLAKQSDVASYARTLRVSRLSISPALSPPSQSDDDNDNFKQLRGKTKDEGDET